MRGPTYAMAVSCALFLGATTEGPAQQFPASGLPGDGSPRADLRQLVTGSSSADGSEPATPPPGQIESTVNPSQEGMSAGRRDPFWPVGYVPPRKPVKLPILEPASTVAVKGRDPEPVVRPVVWEQARAQLDLRGVSSIGHDKTTGKPRYIAAMAGKLVEDGDTVSIVLDGQVYRWKVVSVGATGVQLVKLDVRAE
ncbi:MAG: hypothetical protein WCS01_15795 [bacterium]